MAEVEEHLLTNKPIDAALVHRVERHLGKPAGTFADWVGKHVQSHYPHVVCGSAHVTSAAGTVIAPLSFISAAAGVALAAELVKRSSPALSRYALDNYFRFDTLAAPNPEFRQVRRQDPTGRCICHDADYISVFPDPEIVSALSAQLGWSHFVELLPLADQTKRDFYAEMCRVERWSVRTFRDKIGGMLYERTALSKRQRAGRSNPLACVQKSAHTASHRAGTGCAQP